MKKTTCQSSSHQCISTGLNNVTSEQFSNSYIGSNGLSRENKMEFSTNSTEEEANNIITSTSWIELNVEFDLISICVIFLAISIQIFVIGFQFLSIDITS